MTEYETARDLQSHSRKLTWIMAWNEGWAADEALALVAGAVFLVVVGAIGLMELFVWEMDIKDRIFGDSCRAR